MLVIFLVFNTTAIVLAIICNGIAMDGVVHGNITLKGYRRYLISLLVSDIYICVIKSMFFIRQAVANLTDLDPQVNKCFHKMERSLEMTGFIAFTLNLSAMFFDHFLGLVFPIRYRDLTNSFLARSMIFIIWAVALLIGLADHPIRTSIEYVLEPAREAPVLPVLPIVPNNCSPPISASSFQNDPSTIFLGSGSGSGSGFGSVPTTGSQYRSTHLLINSQTPQSLGTSRRRMAKRSSSTRFTTPADFRTLKSSQIKNNTTISLTTTTDRLPCDNESLDSVIDAMMSYMNQRAAMMESNPSSSLNWCSYYGESNYHVSLDWVVIGLAVGTVVFMTVCNAIFSGRIRKISAAKSANRTKQKMRKLVVTTLLLLGSFSICWLPFVSYEIAMLLVVQGKHANQDDSEQTISVDNIMLAHQILYSLFICSPLVAPFVFIFRISAVKKSLIKRHTSFYWLGKFGSEAENEMAEQTLMPATAV